MCRSIKQLRNPIQPPTDAEIEAAALQFVRKVSGYRVPSAANQHAFETAVADVARATRLLLDSLVVRDSMRPYTHTKMESTVDQGGVLAERVVTRPI
jgi:hypothetical protein